MTKPAQNPSVNTAFNSDYIDSAILHLDGASGLLWLMQTTLEPTATELPDSEAVGIIKTVHSLIQWAYDDLVKDQDCNGHVWTTVMQWLDGVRGGLSALRYGYLNECDLPNNKIQIAALHSLQAVIREALAYVSSYGDEGSV
ncbi:MAG: hypothetical protein VXW65_02785 [Pseudomonadota bacterium]|nr:hypothetical protein [Pseudomonadota bacterium]